MTENPTTHSSENELNPEKKEDQADSSDKEVKKRDLPQVPVEIINLTKSGGITIPKNIREQMEEKQTFAFWQEEDRFILMPIKEYEIPDLQLVGASPTNQSDKSSSTKSSKKKTSRKRKGTSSSKSSTGPQPELTKYFPYQIANQDKIQNAIEASFYKLTEDPPKIDEVIDRIKYIIINYGTGEKTNDSRLKHTIILFILDAIEKIPTQDFSTLFLYLDEKIVHNIDSTFLYEQSIIMLCGAALKASKNELALKFLQNTMETIDKYSQVYAIMQGIKSLVKTINRTETPLPEAFQIYIKDNLKKYVIADTIPQNLEGSEEEGPIRKKNPLNTDNCLEIIEQLEILLMIDAATEATQALLNRIPTEDVHVDTVRAKLNELSKK